MTISLRHIYAIFILALIAAFTIHARADERKTGGLFTKLQDGLNEDGSPRDSTNCVFCGYHVVCGDLSQKLTNGLSLKKTCENATANLQRSIKNCPSQKENYGRWLDLTAGKRKTNNYSSIKSRFDDAVVLGTGEFGEGSKINVVSVPSYRHYKKLRADKMLDLEKGTDQVNQIPEDKVLAYASNLTLDEKTDKEIEDDVRECVRDANKKAVRWYNKNGKQAYKTKQKEVSEEEYHGDIAGAVGLRQKDYYPKFAADLDAKCAQSDNSRSNSKTEGYFPEEDTR